MVANMVLQISVSFVTSQRAEIFIAMCASTHIPTTVEKTKKANEFAEGTETHNIVLKTLVNQIIIIWDN